MLALFLYHYRIGICGRPVACLCLLGALPGPTVSVQPDLSSLGRQMKEKTILPILASLTLAASLFVILSFHGLLHVPGLSGYRFLTVVTGSMEPALPTGCIISVKTSEKTLHTPGDIITYSTNGIYITHRISSVGFDGTFYYQTKGDANKYPDPYVVRIEDVLGRVVFVSPPLLSGAITFVRSGAALAFSTLMFFCIVMAAALRTPKKLPKPGG